MKNEMTYLITGASGHLGNTLAKMLSQKNAHMRLFIYEKETPESLKGVNAEIVHGDITQARDLEKLFEGLAPGSFYVLHLASSISLSSYMTERLWQTNVEGTRNVVALARKYGAKRLLYCSSVHAIPELEKNKTITEVTNFDMTKVKGPYAKTKAAASAVVMCAHESGLNTVIVHPSGIIGPNDYTGNFLVKTLLSFVNYRLPVIVTGGYDIVDVRDVAQGILRALYRGENGSAYILSNKYFTLSELLVEAAKILGRKQPKIILPMWLAKVFARPAEWLAKLGNKKTIYTSYALYTLTSNAKFSHAKADKELGYITRSMTDTLRDTIAFFVQHKLVAKKALKGARLALRTGMAH